ncbi:MAG: BLUF domain-containing protein [Alphaproteobacteria bacterium]|jgi:hypothetical protein
MDLTHVLYLSSAHHLSNQEELQDILEVAQRNNLQAGVSGMLLYDKGCIIQYFEGPSALVAVIWEKIQHDPRHKDIIVLSEGLTPELLFPDWSMGFEDGDRFGGFNLDWHALQDRIPDQLPTLARTMMRVFYTGGSQRVHVMN